MYNITSIHTHKYIEYVFCPQYIHHRNRHNYLPYHHFHQDFSFSLALASSVFDHHSLDRDHLHRDYLHVSSCPWYLLWFEVPVLSCTSRMQIRTSILVLDFLFLAFLLLYYILNTRGCFFQKRLLLRHIFIFQSFPFLLKRFHFCNTKGNKNNSLLDELELERAL